MPRIVQPQALRYISSVVLTFPYDPDLIEAIKEAFPPACRTYDPGAKAWTVKAPYVDDAVELLLDFYPDAAIRFFGNQGQQQAPRRPESDRANPHAALFLLPNAPPEVVRAAYNALVKTHHPDVVAPEQKLLAHQTMLRLNAAIEALRDRGAA